MNELNTLSKRLKYAREAKGLSQAKLGKAAGISQSAIAAIEAERNKGSTNIATLAAILDVNPMWLETGKGEKEIAVYQANGAQFGDNAQITGQNDFRVSQKHCAHQAAPPSQCDAVMPDQSLAPLIPQGSELWLDTQQTDIQDGKIYCVEYGGAKWFRRLFRLPENRVRLAVFDNKNEFPEHDVPLQKVKIIGRVVRWAVAD